MTIAHQDVWASLHPADGVPLTHGSAQGGGIGRTKSIDKILLAGNVPLQRSAASELAITLGDGMQF